MIERHQLRQILSTMPPLEHSTDVCQSEVVRWMIDQPLILEWLFQVARGTTDIQFDRATGKWIGRTPIPTMEI